MAKRNQPCDPCCSGGGHNVCSCTGIDDVISCTFRYLTAPTTLTTVTFDMTWNSGTVTIYNSGGSYTVTGYWESDCVDLPDNYNCGLGAESCNDICSAKFYFFCDYAHGTRFRMAADFFTGANCSGDRYNGGFIDCAGYPPLSGPYDYDEHNTPTACSPFSWRYPAIGLNPTYTVTE